MSAGRNHTLSRQGIDLFDLRIYHVKTFHDHPSDPSFVDSSDSDERIVSAVDPFLGK
jgi:hypothetical protein